MAGGEHNGMIGSGEHGGCQMDTIRLYGRLVGRNRASDVGAPAVFPAKQPNRAIGRQRVEIAIPTDFEGGAALPLRGQLFIALPNGLGRR